MSEPTFKIAKGPWLWLLDTLDLIAIVMPWRTVYCKADWFHDPTMRTHEMVHIAQIERHGAVWFSLLYLYYLARYGYRQNPLEIEAYESHEEAHAQDGRQARR